MDLIRFLGGKKPSLLRKLAKAFREGSPPGCLRLEVFPISRAPASLSLAKLKLVRVQEYLEYALYGSCWIHGLQQILLVVPSC